jgi:hypothetical protein
MMTLQNKIESLDGQILCGGCEDHYMEAVDAQTAKCSGLPVREFVPHGTEVALVCRGCTWIESGDERL